jgi:protein tyrosine phosphatase
MFLNLLVHRETVSVCACIIICLGCAPCIDSSLLSVLCTSTPQVMRQEEFGPDCTRRVLQLSCEATGATHHLHHYHFHAWPDHGTPDSSSCIRAMCKALKPDHATGAPIVVHCSAVGGRFGGGLSNEAAGMHTSSVASLRDVCVSLCWLPLRLHAFCVAVFVCQRHGPSHPCTAAGVHCPLQGIGRTGTFCAIDILLQRLDAWARSPSGPERAEVEDTLDVPSLVHHLRTQRMGMVQVRGGAAAAAAAVTYSAASCVGPAMGL